MNIAIVGLDYDFVVYFSKSLAVKMKMKFVDFENEFEKEMLTTDNLEILNGQAEVKEAVFLNQLAQQKNIVLSISNESFLSNRNYEVLNDFFIILIEKKEDKKILKNIQKIIKKHCKIAIKQENININEILNIIKG